MRCPDYSDKATGKAEKSEPCENLAEGPAHAPQIAGFSWNKRAEAFVGHDQDPLVQHFQPDFAAVVVLDASWVIGERFGHQQFLSGWASASSIVTGLVHGNHSRWCRDDDFCCLSDLAPRLHMACNRMPMALCGTNSLGETGGN